MFRRVSGGALSGWLIAAAMGAGEPSAAVRTGRDVRHGVSRPMSEIARKAPAPATRITTGSKRTNASAPSSPPVVRQFDGATANDNLPFYEDVFPPPDPNGAVGVDHYFQAINLVFRIFDKDGNTVLGPLPTASLWSDLGGICATGSARTPLVRFDVLAARWVVAQSAFDPSAVERWIEESVVTFATPIMSHLGKTGRSSLFQLVDDLQLSVDNLRPVLDAMNIKFGWVDVDKSNLKGDWQVTLTSRGADYLKRNIR